MMARSILWLALVALVAAEEHTWPSCPSATRRLVTQPGTTDSNVTDLWLTDCDVQRLSSNQLVLPNVKNIYLDRGNIKAQHLPLKLFQNCPKLKSVSFSENDMTGAPDALLQGVEIESLWIDECSLNEVPKFVHVSSLLFLYLSKNRITTLDDPATFSSLENLIWLRLEHNRITSINANVFKPLTSIEEISLNNNKLEHVHEKLFQNLENLEKVFLNNNEIKYILPNAFNGCQNLRELNLSRNKLTYLPTSFVSKLNSLTRFYFYKNPWQCACLEEVVNDINGRSKSLTYTKSTKSGERKPECVPIEGGQHCNRDAGHGSS